MRLRLCPLDAGDVGLIAAGDGHDCRLWSQRLRWTCRGVNLDLIVLGPEPVELPSPERTEPPEGAVARVVKACAGWGALVLLANPAEAFGPGRIAFADGIRLIGIATPEDEACWDALLALGQPVYGVRGTVVIDAMSAHPASVISSLAYGNCLACEGLEPVAFHEDRTSVSWDAGRDDAVATIIIKGGFEAQRIAAPTGSYTDQGHERTVRIVLRSGDAACWTQPRMIAPRRH